MATIQSLAPETISHILYIAYPVDQYLQRKARRGFYRLTSLVCRSWTTFAQAALWRFVYLDNYSIERFVAAGAGRYRIKKLFVSSEKSVAVGTLLRTVQGVQELEVLRSGSINSSCLSGTNLRDLKYLRLHFTEFNSRSIPELAFNLSRLDINNTTSHRLLSALSRQSSITSLRFQSTESATDDQLKTLLPVAPQLIALQLHLCKSDAGTAAAADFMRHCRQLRHFAVGTELMREVEQLESPLASWTVHRFGRGQVAELQDVLNLDLIALSRLERLEVIVHDWKGNIGRDGLSETRTWDGWLGIEEVCREKNIELGARVI